MKGRGSERTSSHMYLLKSPYCNLELRDFPLFLMLLIMEFKTINVELIIKTDVLVMVRFHLYSTVP